MFLILNGVPYFDFFGKSKKLTIGQIILEMLSRNDNPPKILDYKQPHQFMQSLINLT